MELHELKEQKEIVILVGIERVDEEGVEESLTELGDLAKTAGAEVAGRVIQRREKVHPATYLGKGKLQELKEKIWELDATGIICDDELSPAQMNHLQEELDCKIMDRTLLILDIFARHAVSREGKIQVELAQLRYRAARLAGLGNSLSRLGGGIGTRGPGEKRLEMDRRRIRVRIHHLKQELEQVVRHRERIRDQRKKAARYTAALVGYTSVGKSALFRQLTGENVLVDPKLFATLDTCTRRMQNVGGQEILLTDTVGFIRKLPHHLIDAFRSTLEEARYADLIIHMADISNPQVEAQMHTVYETLRELGVKDQPVITLLNKIDAVEEQPVIRDFRADCTVAVSAKTGQGIEEFLHMIEGILRTRAICLEAVYPYQEAGKIQLIRRYGEIQEEAYQEDGIRIRAYIPAQLYESVRPLSDRQK